MRLTPDRMGGRSTLRSSRSGGRDCPPDIWIDGVRAPGLNIDDVPLGVDTAEDLTLARDILAAASR